MKTLKKTFITLAVVLALVVNFHSVAYAIDTTEYLTDENQIYELIREAMVERKDTFNVKLAHKGELDEGYFTRWMEKALDETNKSNEGDYLRWHLCNTGVDGEAWIYPNDMYYYSLDFYFSYYTTAEQEQILKDKIDSVLEELDVVSMRNDYEKVVAIYDYVCENVTYDHNNLNNEEYTLKYSAYAALVNGTSVCQGYSNLMYRMLREAGIDSRIISGLGNGGDHAWNIVELDGQYYYIDATWDAVREEYEFFLKGTTDFSNHESDDEYLTEKFLEKYPIAESEYVYIEEKVVPGDLNGSDSINLADLMLMRRCIAGGYDISIDLKAADVNGDEKVNLADLMLLRRYIAGGYGVVLQ